MEEEQLVEAESEELKISETRDSWKDSHTHYSRRCRWNLG